PQTIRPFEGDLLFFPLNRKLFEIKFVEHEAVFYQMGSLQTFDITCELYEYNNEIFDTGVDEIDNVYKYRMNRTVNEEPDEEIPFDGEFDLDPLAGNTDFELEGRKTIDWSEKDPFSEGGVY